MKWEMDMDQLGEVAAEFKKIVNDELGERIPAAFMAWLEEETDFFTAPASTKYHGSYQGGLLLHSMTVYKRLINIVNQETGGTDFSERRGSVAMTALFHDLCKVNQYKEARDKSGKRYYTFIQDALPLGHSEKSLYLLTDHGIKLTDEEALAIRWHMGAYDTAVKGGCRDYAAALKKTPLVLALHEADMRATYWDED